MKWIKGTAIDSLKKINHIQFHFKELLIYNEIKYYQYFSSTFLHESTTTPFILHLFTFKLVVSYFRGREYSATL